MKDIINFLSFFLVSFYKFNYGVGSLLELDRCISWCFHLDLIPAEWGYQLSSHYSTEKKMHMRGSWVHNISGRRENPRCQRRWWLISLCEVGLSNFWIVETRISSSQGWGYNDDPYSLPRRLFWILVMWWTILSSVIMIKQLPSPQRYASLL